MRRFFVDKILVPGTLEINGAEAHHISNVVRLRPGDVCMLVNGDGQEASARVLELTPDGVLLEVGVVATAEIGRLKLLVLQGYLKERKLDDLVRPLSELGAAAFLPVFTQRSVPVLDERRQAAKVERWRKLAAEALKQHRGHTLMQVDVLPDFAAAVAKCADCDIKLFFWEEATFSLKAALAEVPADGRPLTAALFLGPEGGFSAREAQIARQHGFKPVSLGSRVLRAQTAALTATALLQYALGDLG